MNFKKKVTKNNYIRETVTVLNGLLDLTPREMDILISMIKIDISWKPRSSVEVKDVLSTDNRRLIFKDTNINKSNFTKMFNKFKSIGLLVLSSDGKYVMNELLKPTFVKDVKTGKEFIEIKFILEMSDAIQQTI